MGAGALILAQTTNRSLVAALVTGLGAVRGLATRFNLFWTFLAGGRLGFQAVI
jgi:chromate transporter